MSFAGHVSAMITSMKENRNRLKKENKNPLDKGQTFAGKHEKWVDPVLINEADRQKLHASIQTNSKREKKREMLILVITLTVIFLCVYFIFW